MIYIHIPFCERKCNYCAFNSKIAADAEKDFYVDALIREIKLRGDNSASETIYFGGGTPTTLNLNQLEKILNTVQEKFVIDEQTEITIEANPCTLDENFLRGLKLLGFNRLSIGVQSFNNDLLKILGRLHNAQMALTIIECAKKFFNNISIDLMYGLPAQKLNDVQCDLEQIKSLEVQHISIYGLEVEEGTKFYQLERSRRLNLPDENLSADMYDLITTMLPNFDYQRYEISNFAKKNFHSRHNCGYWTWKKYFGFGAGAHSFDGKIRTSNVKDVAAYIQGSDPILEEVVTNKVAMEEFCFLGLRMTNGINARIFDKNFERSIWKIFGSIIEKNRQLDLLRVEGDKIFLTARGMALGNEVFADFLI